ncbi:MAG TPA: hypothetical protein VLX68_09255, partial [Chitinivibrionales bacterium]|nr:hypothetical protein [Chitinivibrionales bacterium]
FPEVANNWTASRLNASSYFLRDVDIHTSKNKDKFGSRSVQIQEYTSTPQSVPEATATIALFTAEI